MRGVKTLTAAEVCATPLAVELPGCVGGSGNRGGGPPALFVRGVREELGRWGGVCRIPPLRPLRNRNGVGTEISVLENGLRVVSQETFGQVRAAAVCGRGGDARGAARVAGERR